MIISWDESLALGNALIDTQHRMLVLLFKKLDIAIKQQLPHKVIMGITLEIKKFAEFHFLSEENLMNELKYPDVTNHEGIHSRLLSQLNVIIAKVNRKEHFPDEMLDMMHAWLTTHALHEDMKIVDHIRKSQFRPIAEEQYGLYRK